MDNQKLMQQFDALLEMIEPDEGYSGGTISYEMGRELQRYIRELEQAVDELGTELVSSWASRSGEEE
jgi:hypothetical protein